MTTGSIRAGHVHDVRAGGAIHERIVGAPERADGTRVLRVLIVRVDEAGCQAAAYLGASGQVTVLDLHPNPSRAEVASATVVRGDGTTRLVRERAGVIRANLVEIV